MDQAVDEVEQAFRSESAMTRTWIWGGFELFYDAHQLNLWSVKRRDESFRLLDVGCGTGELVRRVARDFRNAEVVGVDANQKSIEQARAEPSAGRTEFIEGSFETVTDLGPFDVVICSEVFEHVERPEELLNSIHSVLAPGGWLSFSTPSGWIWRRPRIGLFWEFLNAPTSPRLRPFRVRNLGVRGMRIARFNRDVRLNPERNWRDALPFHPAVHPPRTLAMLEEAGFSIELRTSSVWHLDPRFGLAARAFRALERRRSTFAAQKLFYFLMLQEALLNLVRPLRVFETRLVVLARRRDAEPSSSRAG